MAKKLNLKGNDLYSFMNGDIARPVLHEEGEVLSNDANNPIYPKKNDAGKVVGYSLGEEG